MSMTEPQTAAEVRQRIRDVRARRAGKQFYELSEPPVIMARPKGWSVPLESSVRESERDVLCLSSPSGTYITVQFCRDFVARHYNRLITEVISIRKEAALVRVRQIGCYVAKRLTKQSFPEIGRRFGGRDHTTIMHAVRKIEAMMESLPGFRAEIEILVWKCAEAAEKRNGRI